MDGEDGTPLTPPPTPPPTWLKALRGRGGVEREAREGVSLEGGGNSSVKREKKGEDRPRGGLERGEEYGEGEGESMRGEASGDGGTLFF